MAAAPETARLRRILVGDDEEMVRHVLREVLLRYAQPCEVQTAEDGAVARARIPAFRPHLIITDLAMPNLNGASLCRWVKSNGFADTKVLVFTANAESALLSDALDAGAEDWIAKPAEPKHLLARVNRLLAGEPSGAL